MECLPLELLAVVGHALHRGARVQTAARCSALVQSVHAGLELSLPAGVVLEPRIVGFLSVGAVCARCIAPQLIRGLPGLHPRLHVAGGAPRVVLNVLAALVVILAEVLFRRRLALGEVFALVRAKEAPKEAHSVLP